MSDFYSSLNDKVFKEKFIYMYLKENDFKDNKQLLNYLEKSLNKGVLVFI